MGSSYSSPASAAAQALAQVLANDENKSLDSGSQIVLCKNFTASRTITFNDSPNDSDKVIIKDLSDNANTYPILLQAGSGHTCEISQIDEDSGAKTFLFIASESKWIVYAENEEMFLLSGTEISAMPGKTLRATKMKTATDALTYSKNQESDYTDLQPNVSWTNGGLFNDVTNDTDYATTAQGATVGATTGVTLYEANESIINGVSSSSTTFGARTAVCGPTGGNSVIISLGSSRDFNKIGVNFIEASTWYIPDRAKISISTDGFSEDVTVLGTFDVGAYDELLSGLSGNYYFLVGNQTATHVKYEFQSDSSQAVMFKELMVWDATAATSGNDSKVRLYSGSSISISPATLVLKDPSAVNVPNDGSTVAYSVNEGAFSSQLSLEAFRALDDISGVTTFDVKPVPINFQGITTTEISGPSSESYHDENGNFKIKSNTQDKISGDTGGRWTATQFSNGILELSEDTTISSKYGTYIIDASSGDVEITLAPVSTYFGVELEFKRIDSSNNSVTISANGSETIDSSATKSLNVSKANLKIKGASYEWKIISEYSPLFAQYDPTTRIGRNLFDNGDYSVSQRGTTFLNVSAGTYTIDRTVIVYVGNMEPKVTQSLDCPTIAQAGAYIGNSFKLEITTASASLSAGDYLGISTGIEGQHIRQIYKNAFVHSFWVKSSLAGAYSNSYQSGNLDLSYIGTYTIAAEEIDEWVFKSVVVITEPTAGTWYFNNDLGMRVNFMLGCGSNFHGSTGVWNSGNKLANSNQVNLAETLGNTFQVTGVQLEKGTEPTPFEFLDISERLKKCYRFYQKSYTYEDEPGSISVNSGHPYAYCSLTQYLDACIDFEQSMRTTPSVIIYKPSNGTAGEFETISETGSYSADGVEINEKGIKLLYSSGLATGQMYQFHWAASAEF